MGIVNQYPYTNFHELNLDWIIQKLNEAGGGDITLRANADNTISLINGNGDVISKIVVPYAETAGNAEDIPTKVSDLTNDTGFITGSYIEANPNEDGVIELKNIKIGNTIYHIPSAGLMPTFVNIESTTYQEVIE